MAIVSWQSVIDVLMQKLSAEHSPLVGDLQQLVGLCQAMDENAFRPFVPEDFGIDRARRITSFYNIVDKVADELINSTGASSKGLKATPQYAGYCRYLRWRNYGLSIQFNCQRWMDLAETPFWLAIQEIQDQKWVFPRTAHVALAAYELETPKHLFTNNRSGELLVPLYAPDRGTETESEVVRGIYEAVARVFERLCIGPLSSLSGVDAGEVI